MRKVASPIFVIALCALSIVGSRAQGPQTVFINEFHYDNTGGDTGEFIEIAGPAGTNLSGYTIVLYNGSTPTAAVTYGSARVLSGVIPDQQNGFGTLSFAYPVDGIQNGGNDAIALLQGTTVIQFLSYEGVATASNGPAAGMTSTDIGVSENGTNAIGTSLRLIGSGNRSGDFTWATVAAASAGAVNQGQTFVPAGDVAPAVTGTTPATGASNVPVNSTITINFSEAVNAASAFSLSCNGLGHAFTQSGSPAASFTLTPDASLPFGANCTVSIAADQVTDADTQDPPDQMAANVAVSFDTEPEADAEPQIVSTVPVNGATEVDPAASIVINFNEPMTATTSAFAIDCGGSVAFGQTAGASTSFILDPNVNLPGGVTCTVTVAASQVSDVDTNDPPDRLSTDHAFSFTTAVPPATNVMINEIDADTPGAGVDFAEFVELYDGGVGDTPLDGLTVVFFNGSVDTSYAAFDLDGRSTDANGYFTLGNPDVPGVDLVFEPGDFGLLQNGADAVALVIGSASSFPNGTGIGSANVLDAVVYDTDDANDLGLLGLLNGGEPQVNENGGGDGPNQSIGRCANGTGGLRNTSTYRTGAPSPDGPNSCPPPAPPSPIVISQFYGSGGNSGAVYQNDYVELYNRGTEAVDITGWTLQYAAATGSGWDFNKTPLGGPIGPGEYYLVKLASNGAIGAAVPPANVTGPINMSGTSGKIALVGSGDSLAGDCPLFNQNLKDLVGYGTATCGEGDTTAPALSATTADFRINGGATDTNRNAADFNGGAPNPRRTAAIVELRPFLVSSDPASNANTVPRDPTIVLSFSEPVTTTEPWFDLTCAVSGPHNSYTRAGSGNFIDLTINDPLTPGETCTISVLATGVHDVDTDDGPNTDTLPWNYAWSFVVANGTPPPYPPDVHLTFGNPTSAMADEGAPDNFLMSKPEFALSYNRDQGRPNWVSWHLSNDWYGTLARVDTFRADPQVPPDWYRVQGFDFSGSGFDRGHMVPNADRDKETSVPINQATFLMTNMLAQAPANNQGPWADLEEELRAIADQGNELYIVAGPAGMGGTGSGGFADTIAGGRVTVPAATWKVALVLPKMGGDDLSRVTCSTRTIAVIMPNDQAINPDWQFHLTSVDAVEALTGYDLFANLPPDVEYCVEAGVNGANPPADATPPAIQCDAPDGAWHADNVSLTCTATDSESGLADPANASITLSTLVPAGVEDANAATDSRVVCDAVGNCATAGPIGGNKIDRRAPDITLVTPADGAIYQLNQTVNALYSCAGGASGSAACVGTVVSGAPIDTASSGPKTFVVTAVDGAGNASTASVSYTVQTGPAHKRTPSISINNVPNDVTVGGSFTPTYLYDGDGVIHLASHTPSVCTIKANRIVMFIASGTCTIVASATPTGSVNRALGPLQSFVIAP